MNEIKFDIVNDVGKELNAEIHKLIESYVGETEARIIVSLGGTEFFEILTLVMEKVTEHSETWRDKPEDYWMARLMQEVGEAASSLVGDHEHPVEWELIQIASICMNWIAMRKGNRDV